MKLILVAEHGVGDVLRHLRAFRRHDEERPLGAKKRRVKLLQFLADVRHAPADDDAIGLHEVVDRGAFLQELRVRRDLDRLAGFLDHAFEKIAVGADGDGALDDDDCIRPQMFGHRFADGPDGA